jgi:hypothetical protein
MIVIETTLNDLNNTDIFLNHIMNTVAFVSYVGDEIYLGSVSNKRELFGLVGPKELLFTLETKLSEEDYNFFYDILVSCNFHYSLNGEIYTAL